MIIIFCLFLCFINLIYNTQLVSDVIIIIIIIEVSVIIMVTVIIIIVTEMDALYQKSINITVENLKKNNHWKIKFTSS